MTMLSHSLKYVRKYLIGVKFLIMVTLSYLHLQRPRDVVAIKAITKKNLAKSQNLLGKEIKILKVSVDAQPTQLPYAATAVGSDYRAIY